MRDLINLFEKMTLSIAFFLCMAFPLTLEAQTLTLDEVNNLARQNYPLIKQKDLIRQTADISIENLGKAHLPQITLSGQASINQTLQKWMSRSRALLFPARIRINIKLSLRTSAKRST